MIFAVIALLDATVFLWIFHTGFAEENVINLQKPNISEVREDIIDASPVTIESKKEKGTHNMKCLKVSK